MRNRCLAALLGLFVVWSTVFVGEEQLWAEEKEAIGSIELAVPEGMVGGEKKSIFRKYKEFLDGEFEKLSEMDLYGVTSQLPKGYLSMKWDWGTIKAKHRYNDKRKLGPVMPPITFSDGQGNPLIKIDMGLSGHGGGHTFQWSYGIIDELDWYFELPFTYMNINFYPTPLAVGTDKAGNNLYVEESTAKLLGIRDPKTFSGCDMNYYVLPKLNRPPVAVNSQAKWLLGDINTGFSWNIYRNSRFSVALTPRVFLPTGHTPHPNNNLTYGTGAEIETGIGGWAVGFTQGYDLRLFKYSYWIDVILSSEFTTAYAFQQQRDYPTNFPDMRLTDDPETAVDESTFPTAGESMDPMTFPQLHDLKGTFSYTPGWSLDWSAQLNVQLAIIGLGFAYGISHSQEPELNGNQAFVNMAKGLELLGAQTIEAIKLGVSLSLLGLYVPLDVSFSWQKVVDGYNAIVFDDFFQLTVKGYIPLFR
jgi:hypothetical protein